MVGTLDGFKVGHFDGAHRQSALEEKTCQGEGIIE
jgi:hypothetical protein